MTGWTAKVFWSAATAVPDDAVWAVALDHRRARTPAKAPLTLPTQGAAQAVAAEWAAQTAVLNAATMPLTRLANAAIDKVAPQKAEVAAVIAAYGETDLLCYRAPLPVALTQRQAALWDPVLDWAATALGARLATRSGVMPVLQAPDAMAHLHTTVAQLDPYRMAALHERIR